MCGWMRKKGEKKKKKKKEESQKKKKKCSCAYCCSPSRPSDDPHQWGAAPPCFQVRLCSRLYSILLYFFSFSFLRTHAHILFSLLPPASVFLFNSKGELLLQQRADEKVRPLLSSLHTFLIPFSRFSLSLSLLSLSLSLFLFLLFSFHVSHFPFPSPPLLRGSHHSVTVQITFPGYFTNTCCSHPLNKADELEVTGHIGKCRRKEDIYRAKERRKREEHRKVTALLWRRAKHQPKLLSLGMYF